MHDFHIPTEYEHFDEENLPKGSLGIVKKFTRPDDSSSVVIKKYIDPFSSDVRSQRILRELNLLRTVKHQNIVQLLGSCRISDKPDQDESYYHITVYCGESLSNKIAEGQYSMKDVKKWIMELLRAVECLHSHGTIHGNLNPKKICISNHNILILTDFGNGELQDSPSEKTVHQYMPIEQLVSWNSKLTSAVDIWSASIIMCELITGAPLFNGKLVRTTLQLQMKYFGTVEMDILAKITSEADRNTLTAKSLSVNRKDIISILQDNILPERCIQEQDIIDNEHPLRDFLDVSLQLNPDKRILPMKALFLPFLRTPQPWDMESEEQVSDELKTIIDKEFMAANPIREHLSSRPWDKDAMEGDDEVPEDLKARIEEEFATSSMPITVKWRAAVGQESHASCMGSSSSDRQAIRENKKRSADSISREEQSTLEETTHHLQSTVLEGAPPTKKHSSATIGISSQSINKPTRNFHEIKIPRLNSTIHLPHELFHQGYTLNMKILGRFGENGVVTYFECPDRPPIVVKKFHTLVNKAKMLLILRELNLLKSMRHPNILQLVDKYAVDDNSSTLSQVPETMKSFYHITLYCGVPLSSLITKGDYGMAQVKTWIRELLCALQYIHALGISHRDLNPNSICIDDEKDRKLTLLGFGKARVLDNTSNTMKVGDNFYMAFEMQIKMKTTYDEMVDIWSMAVTLCEMLTGKVLFTGKDGKIENVKYVMKHMIEYCGPVEESVLAKVDSDVDRNGIIYLQKGKVRKDFQEFLRADVGTGRGIGAQDIDDEPELRSFIDRTLQHNPKARMSADEALSHPFLLPQEISWKQAKPQGEEATIRTLLENIFGDCADEIS